MLLLLLLCAGNRIAVKQTVLCFTVRPIKNHCAPPKEESVQYEDERLLEATRQHRHRHQHHQQQLQQRWHNRFLNTHQTHATIHTYIHIKCICSCRFNNPFWLAVATMFRVVLTVQKSSTFSVPVFSALFSSLFLFSTRYWCFCFFTLHECVTLSVACC